MVTVSGRLTAFAVGLESGAIPAAVRERAAAHFLDTVGCGLAAVGVDAGGEASEIEEAQGGQPDASVLGHPQLLPAALAALANGTRCHGLDFDDTHEAGICHCSTVVAPAALAAAEETGASGRELIDAYVVGSEVALRLAVAMADGLYERGFHPTPVCGAFGAAAAVARLHGLDSEQARNALGIVGSLASGLFEYLADGSSTKPLHAGWAAHAGVQAALLARAGATGPATVVEGRFGLMASHVGTTEGTEEITGALGDRWECAESSIKAFPACHFVHSSTWAAAEIAESQGLAASDIAEIVVRIPSEGEALVLVPPEHKAAPRTPYDAKFSLPFSVAHRLVRGELALTSFLPEAIADPEVLALAARVRFEPLMQPPSRFAGGARVVLHSGDGHDRFMANVPGSPRNPLTQEWVRSKFTANARLALAPPVVEQLAEALFELDESPSLERVLEACRSASPSGARLPL